MPIRFVDLFCGIGGFHAVGTSFGWEAVYACDIDVPASEIYRKNWNLEALRDITTDASSAHVNVPKHEVLFAGFPCQPFSKGGFQRGMDETRGTLFWNIARIIEVRRPRIVVLENVRNIAGPRHRHEWEVIILTLRELGYAVSSEPLVVSPHRIPPRFGGRPQTRDRIYINATYVEPSRRNPLAQAPPKLNLDTITEGWTIGNWDLRRDVPLKKLTGQALDRVSLRGEEILWIETWEDFLRLFKKKFPNGRLPGFPLWADVWTDELRVEKGDPDWKVNFIKKNEEFYLENKSWLRQWLKAHGKLIDFPNSRRKFEWQARESGSVWDCLIQLRPSGIRVKKATYAPAAVAMNQTTIFGPMKRRLDVTELAALQGLPNWFDFSGQEQRLSYKQLGNAINVASAYQSVVLQVKRDRALLRHSPELVRSVLEAPISPDSILHKRRIV